MLTFTSCQKDDAPQETVQEGPEFQVEKLTRSQLENNRSLRKALKDAKENLGISVAQKSFYDSINGFYIEDSEVNHVSSGDYESYTFKITDSSDTTHLKNMVFSKQIDSTYQAFIVAYDLNYISLDDIRQGNIPQDLFQYVTYTPVNSGFQYKMNVNYIGSGDCVGSTEIIPGRNCTVGNHEFGEPCDLESNDWRRAQEATLLVIMELCVGSSSGGGNSDGGNNPPPDNTYPGGLSGFPDGGNDTPPSNGDNSGDPTEPNNNDTQTEPCLSLSNGDCAGVISSPIFTVDFEEKSKLYNSLNLEDRIYLSNNSLLEDILLETLDFEDDSELDKEISKVVIDLAKVYDGEGSTSEIDPTEIIQKLQQAVSEGITSTAEAAHKLYVVLTKLQNLYPSATSDINTFVINPIRISMLQLTNTNVDQMQWMDLLLVWTFELGGNYDGMVNNSDLNPNNDAVLINIHGIDKPLISGDGTNDPNKNVKDLSEPFDVSQIPDSQQGSVNAVRQLALQSIQNNQIPAPPLQSSFSSTFSYGQNEFYDGISNLNIATAFLGSYSVSAVVTNNMDGTYDITFELSNTTGWESGTRLRKDGPDSNSQHDAVIPNKPRGSGINMGGNIKQNFKWTETYP
ncbi:hypothetical protein [Nonlabens sp.]|uniref:hypothetical protein n=1 Tax=Nonlabens sp. TaxID=1888209 RepID=UPI003F695FD2